MEHSIPAQFGSPPNSSHLQGYRQFQQNLVNRPAPTGFMNYPKQEQLQYNHQPPKQDISGPTLIDTNTVELSFPIFLEAKPDQDYIVRDKLGQGGFGGVYMAEAKSPELQNRLGDNRMVVKIAEGKHSQKEKIKKGFDQEVSITWMFRNNLHFVQMCGFSREPDSILMAYYPLGSLDSLLKFWKSRKVQWTKRLVTSLARDLAKGLYYMHKAGIAHLDLKPGNILLHFDEQRGCLRTAIADFGLSNPVTNASLLVSAYQPVEMRGKSLSYASPETFKRLGKDKKARLADPTRGKPHLLLHSDTYAFAVILYELLTRKKPYTYKPRR